MQTLDREMKKIYTKKDENNSKYVALVWRLSFQSSTYFVHLLKIW